MTGEEYANNKVNEQDSSTHSQHAKNSIPNFCGFDLHDAFEAGQDEMKKKAADAFSKVLSSIGFSTPKWKELLSKDFKEILNEDKEGKKDTRI